jgi:hypothetical protein
MAPGLKQLEDDKIKLNRPLAEAMLGITMLRAHDSKK